MPAKLVDLILDVPPAVTIPHPSKRTPPAVLGQRSLVADASAEHAQAAEASGVCPDIQLGADLVLPPSTVPRGFAGRLGYHTGGRRQSVDGVGSGWAELYLETRMPANCSQVAFLNSAEGVGHRLAATRLITGSLSSAAYDWPALHEPVGSEMWGYRVRKSAATASHPVSTGAAGVATSAEGDATSACCKQSQQETLSLSNNASCCPARVGLSRPTAAREAPAMAKRVTWATQRSWVGIHTRRCPCW
jgi:hypothetical protein